MSNKKTQFKKGMIPWNKGLSGYLAGSKNPFWKNASINVKCKNCNKLFKDFPSNDRVFCSRKCQWSWWKDKPRKNKGVTNPKTSGKNHYNWQGGKSIEPYSLDWTTTLKRSIRERDNYTCKNCGKQQDDIELSVHHIDCNKKNCDPKNLITLCRSCHTKTHNKIRLKK